MKVGYVRISTKEQNTARQDVLGVVHFKSSRKFPKNLLN